MADLPPILTSLDEIAERYDAILCDVWGVIHNGVEVFQPACAALQRFRASGKPVVLITNAPRVSREVSAFLDVLKAPRDAWDRLVTSGDVTRDLVAEGPRRIFHIGADSDLGLYEGLDVELVEEFEASGVVCTGLFDDETETPADYADMLRRLRARNLPFICANPDIVVEYGGRLMWCAGALARDYAQLGGRTLIAGKPHAPIYDAALRAVSDAAGRTVAPERVLAIGDGLLTDVKGAVANGMDALFITAGIHAGEYGDADAPDPLRLATFLDGHGLRPAAMMPRLA